MILKFAQPEDLCEIDDLYKGFIAGVSYDRSFVNNSIVAMIKKNSVLCAVIENKIVGGMAGYFFPSIYNSDVYYVAMFYFFPEKYRKHAPEFLERIHQLLETSPANKLVISVPYYQDTEKMDRYYRQHGFELFETQYVRDVNRKEPQHAG